MKNVAARDAAVEEIKNQNIQLLKMNENFKAENEAQNATIQDLNDKVTELEQIKLQNERLILTLRGKLDDALQA